MSARICYLQRAHRGGSITGVHLVGPTSHDFYPSRPNNSLQLAQLQINQDRASSHSANQDSNPANSSFTVAPQAVARFIAAELQSVRGPASLALMCLDAEGAVASWVASPTRDRGAIASLIRMGTNNGLAGNDSGDSEASRSKATPLEYFGTDPLASSIEPFVADTIDRTNPSNPSNSSLLGKLRLRTGASSKSSRAATASDFKPSERLGVLAMIDAPARVIIDELDALDIPVESVSSVWHALAASLDPTPESVDPAFAPLIAIVVGTLDGRVLWVWSRARTLVAAGSLRAVVTYASNLDAADPAASASESGPHVTLGADEAARITNDWLAWSAQLCVAPSRVIALLPEGHDDGQGARRFALRLGAAWQDATVDATLASDPLLAVLTRLAQRLDTTPISAAPATPATSLVGLSTRPGRKHRSMVRWAAAVLLAASVLMIAASILVRSAASDSRAVADTWRGSWREQVQIVYPTALTPQPGKGPLAIISEEVARLGNANKPPPAIEPPMPVLEELETLSLILGNADVIVENIDLDSRAANIRILTLCRDVAYAERLELALNQIDGSWAAAWTMAPSGIPLNARGTRPEFGVRATYTSRFSDEAKRRAEEAAGNTGAPR